MSDLELASEEELINELRRRNAAALIVLSKDLDADHFSADAWWQGGWVAALGLAEFARIRVQQAMGSGGNG